MGEWVGREVGEKEGVSVGMRVVGVAVGELDGLAVGSEEGDREG